MYERIRIIGSEGFKHKDPKRSRLNIWFEENKTQRAKASSVANDERFDLSFIATCSTFLSTKHKIPPNSVSQSNSDETTLKIVTMTSQTVPWTLIGWLTDAGVHGFIDVGAR